MKNQNLIAIATASLLATGAASAQNGNMMNGGNWGGTWMGGTWMDGYGGIWMVVLMVVVVAAIIGWIVSQNKK
jgi:predicted MFS family arabinose efflux permease